MLSRIAIALFVLLSACATRPAPVPTSDELGNRIRWRVEGREIPSITTADYFLYLTIRAPNGKRTATRTVVSLSVSSSDIALITSNTIEMSCKLPRLELIVATGPEPKSTYIVLPPGYTLCCEPGSYYAYRIIDEDPTMAADLNPEVRLSTISKDGSRYFEVQPSDGPLLKRAAMPPGWPQTHKR